MAAAVVVTHKLRIARGVFAVLLCLFPENEAVEFKHSADFLLLLHRFLKPIVYRLAFMGCCVFSIVSCSAFILLVYLSCCCFCVLKFSCETLFPDHLNPVVWPPCHVAPCALLLLLYSHLLHCCQSTF